MPQGSVLDPILINFYITDLFLLIKQTTLYNYTDYNTLDFFQNSVKFNWGTGVGSWSGFKLAQTKSNDS